MISSTRSSESASRSSWKDASSVTSLSSTPSCSTRTSLTRSKTSAREAAMSPLLGVGFGKRADANTLLACFPGFLGHPLAEPGDDAVFDAPRRQAGRRRLDQRPARLAASGCGDLAAEPVERRPDRPLEELEHDVAREAVADDDVGGV